MKSKPKMFPELNGGINESSVKSLIRKHNTNISNNSESKLYVSINDKCIICTGKQLLDYLDANKIDINVISEVVNFVKFCVSPQLFDKIRELFCNSADLQKICAKLKITNIREYKNNYRKCVKLPPLQLITNGLYSDENNIFNICEVFDSITDDVSF